MKATSADILEYESLRALLGRYVSSPPGKAELARIAPHTDAARLAGDLADAAEAVEYLRSAARPQTAARGAAIRIEFGGFPDLTEAVHKLRIEGASLEGKEIFDLFGVLDRAADAKSVFYAVAERFPRLGARAQSIGDFRALLKDLEGKILPDGSVADRASVALARLRRDIERQRKSIQGEPGDLAEAREPISDGVVVRNSSASRPVWNRFEVIAKNCVGGRVSLRDSTMIVASVHR